MDRRFDSFYHFQQYFDQMVIIKVSGGIGSVVYFRTEHRIRLDSNPREAVVAH